MSPTLQLATDADAAEITALYLASRADALPTVRVVHDDDDVRAWVRTIMLRRGETWVARDGGRILGFMRIDGEDLTHLFLLPGLYRRGIGSVLLAKAKALSPGRLRLFTFQLNLRARAFYEAHGFRIVDLNDGTRNEEGEPDVLYAWAGSA
jgi:GNAT superfamily N-acetyltransferase